MQPVDLVLVVLFAVVWPWYGTRFGVPAMRAAVEAGVAGARRSEYHDTMFSLWMFAALAAAAAVQSGRSLHSLRLVLPSGVIALGVAAAAIAGTYLLFDSQARSAARPARRAALRRAIAPLSWFLPQDAADRTVFRMVSVTAGVCEEWLFRGFLLAVLTSHVGVAGAIAVSSGLFGLAHSYQGPVGILKTGLGGVVLAGITWATGSILPAIVVHVLTDWMQGDLIVRVLTEEPADELAALPGAAGTA